MYSKKKTNYEGVAGIECFTFEAEDVKKKMASMKYINESEYAEHKLKTKSVVDDYDEDIEDSNEATTEQLTKVIENQARIIQELKEQLKADKPEEKKPMIKTKPKEEKVDEFREYLDKKKKPIDNQLDKIRATEENVTFEEW
jgi:hypothetical protein